MWKDFFYFTRGERQGILLLLVLIILVYSFPLLWNTWTKDEEGKTAVNECLKEEHLQFIANTDSTKRKKKQWKDWNKNVTNHKLLLHPFDPNTADSLELTSMGLPGRLIRNILSYRKKQGKFRRPEDFRKMYGLSEEMYLKILPYIRIVDTKRLSRMPYSQFRPDSILKLRQEKFAFGTIVNLNRADTAELKKIPGIGSVFARRIVNYRNRLGGYTHLEQLEEIGLKAEAFRSWFAIDTTDIHKLSINDMNLRQLMKHPYLNFYQAKVIVEHRNKYGPIHSLQRLVLYEEFAENDLIRLQPYIRF